MKKYLRQTGYVCAFLWITPAVTAQKSGSLTFIDMAQIQDQSLKSIHSIKAEVNQEQTFLDADGQEIGKGFITYTWIKEGRKTRITSKQKQPATIHKSKNQITRTEDTANTPDGFKSVVANGPEIPSRVDENSIKSASGDLGPEKPLDAAFSINPLSDMLFEISHYNNHWTLLEAAKADRNAQVTPVQVGNKQYYDVKLQLTDKELLRLDPEANFLIKKREQASDTFKGFAEVREYGRIGRFVYPAEIRREGQNLKTKARHFTVTRCKVLALNQPLEAGSFDVHFPPGLLVTDLSKKVSMIWGEDDNPRIIFKNEREYQDWLEAHTHAMESPPAESSVVTPSAFRRNS